MPEPTPTCKHCTGPLPLDAKGARRSYVARRGFCSAACNTAYVPVLRTVLCANETCQRGDGGTRKVFTTYQERARCCSTACNKMQWSREHAWGDASTPVNAIVDIPAEEIERRLEALSRKRKQQRAWLRIDDPWAQRPGAALHQQALVTHSLDLEGALA